MRRPPERDENGRRSSEEQSPRFSSTSSSEAKGDSTPQTMKSAKLLVFFFLLQHRQRDKFDKRKSCDFPRLKQLMPRHLEMKKATSTFILSVLRPSFRPLIFESSLKLIESSWDEVTISPLQTMFLLFLVAN